MDPKHGPERTLDAFAEMTLVQSVMSKPNVYLDELQSDLYSSTGITVSLSTIFQRLRFTRKKLQHVVFRLSESERAEFAEEMSYIDPINVVLDSWNTWEIAESVYNLEHQSQLEMESSLLKGLEFKQLE